MTARLDASSHTVLRANYGRFNQGVLTGELEPIHPGVHADDDDGVRCGHRRLHAAGLGRRSRTSTSRSIPQTRTPRTDEYSVGVERAADGSTRGFGCLHPEERQRTSSPGPTRRGTYREETRTLPDGYSVPVFVLTNATRAIGASC